jgi:hypothetical protein
VATPQETRKCLRRNIYLVYLNFKFNNMLLLSEILRVGNFISSVILQKFESFWQCHGPLIFTRIKIWKLNLWKVRKQGFGFNNALSAVSGLSKTISALDKQARTVSQTNVLTWKTARTANLRKDYFTIPTSTMRFGVTKYFGLLVYFWE